MTFSLFIFGYYLFFSFLISSFDCETDIQKSAARGTIQVTVAGKYPAESDGIFEFVVSINRYEHI